MSKKIDKEAIAGEICKAAKLYKEHEGKTAYRKER